MFRWTLLGTGSSGGVPRVGGDWGACDPAEPKNRRRRCCVLLDRIRQDGQMTRVLIDTSPDLREQLLDARVQHLDAIVFTHDHADQTHGIDDVRALSLRMARPIPVYMDRATEKTLVNRFRYCFIGDGGYPPIVRNAASIDAGVMFRIAGQGGEIALLPLQLIHGHMPSLGFRCGGVAYINDVSQIPEETMQALTGLDVLVLDALRYKPHPTHAHLDLALAWAARLKPRRTVLTNMHIDLDFGRLCAELPPGIEPGYDGLEILLSDSTQT
jgi:phosphoribosyl 1,2-cyclic phosphate phosphodiesterase